MKWFYSFLSRDSNKRVVQALESDIHDISAQEERLVGLSDEALRETTRAFKERLTNGTPLDALLHEAFAVVREVAKRQLQQRHFDVQLMGGMVLHRGGIAEMRTGEGKTLMATLPAYLNALTGKGVHIVTVNDYLAQRDATWMGRIFHALGLTVGIIVQQGGSFMVDLSAPGGLRKAPRAEAYAADITYGTNNEFGFDYLRDNMAMRSEHMVQRPLHYAIVDEVDSILIDEARTPLIISAPAEMVSDQYAQFARIVRTLQKNDDYNVDEKMRAATLTEQGIRALEHALGVENLYAEGGVTLVHHAEQALKAQALFERDKDYVVSEGEIIIVDEFTGRLMHGRRYSEGLHQAIEAKEGVEVQRESETLATVTFQNYFRLYEKISGMTGTAESEAEEFHKIYNLDVTVIPTHQPTVREDRADRIYKSEHAKCTAVTQAVQELHAQGQPVLVGTASIEKNERLSEYFHRAGITHEILNAKNHAREAEILEDAGKRGSVTLATNMAGRGVDIILGGKKPDQESDRSAWKTAHDEVVALGGLFVLGTERHEARRIDNQLRGRSGRQGDPGTSQFYVSMEDDLMRIFGSDRMRGLLERFGFPDDVPIEHRMLSGGIEKAQEKVEGHNFDIRKHLLEYDDVLNKHRETTYKRRRAILAAPDAATVRDRALELFAEEVEAVVSFHTVQSTQWNVQEVIETMRTIMPADAALEQTMTSVATEAGISSEGDARTRSALIDAIMERIRVRYDAATLLPSFVLSDGTSTYHAMVKNVLLRSMDVLWVEHLDAMTRLRQGIGLRGYGQREPLLEYKREGFRMFQLLLESTRKEVVYSLFKVTEAIHVRSLLERQGVSLTAPAKTAGSSAPPLAQGNQEGGSVASVSDAQSGEKIGRNDLCHCGSGKKFKKCHGV